jgi:hypothetical protein
VLYIAGAGRFLPPLSTKNPRHQREEVIYMTNKLKTLEVARELAAKFAKTKSVTWLVEEVSSWSWHFGRYGGYNRKLFLEYLVQELKEVSK